MDKEIIIENFNPNWFIKFNEEKMKIKENLN